MNPKCERCKKEFSANKIMDGVCAPGWIDIVYPPVHHSDFR